MALIYNNSEKVFYKQDVAMTAGFGDTTIQSLYMNKFINVSIPNTTYFNFDTPMYTTYGGTRQYYGQDFNSIFTNFVKPYIRYTFSANTSSFGSGTTIVHDIYRIDYSTYSKAVEESASGNTSDSVEKVKILLREPVTTISAATTAITTNYDLFPDEYCKNLGDFAFQLFEDKGQYFIATKFIFEREQGADYEDFYQLNDNKQLVEVDYEKNFREETLNRGFVITGGTYSGITVYGNFFTYFLLPNKPKIQEPYVEGYLDTFSPTFYFSDVDDGDNFLLQIEYPVSSGDSANFSSTTVYSYQIPKDLTSLDSRSMLSVNDSEDWAITSEKTDIMRKYTVPLQRSEHFWYRIGNTKSIINLFGVKQSVTTFSDAMSATTSSNIISTSVIIENDSPHISNIAPFGFGGYLDATDLYSLSGTVRGSVVTGCTMQLLHPNGNSVTKISDSQGGFFFDNIESGRDYQLNTSYRGYQLDNRIITLTGDTILNFKLKLLWGNMWDTWGKLSGENYFS